MNVSGAESWIAGEDGFWGWWKEGSHPSGRSRCRTCILSAAVRQYSGRDGRGNVRVCRWCFPKLTMIGECETGYDTNLSVCFCAKMSCPAGGIRWLMTTRMLRASSLDPPHFYYTPTISTYSLTIIYVRVRISRVVRTLSGIILPTQKLRTVPFYPILFTDAAIRKQEGLCYYTYICVCVCFRCRELQQQVLRRDACREISFLYPRSAYHYNPVSILAIVRQCWPIYYNFYRGEHNKSVNFTVRNFTAFSPISPSPPSHIIQTMQTCASGPVCPKLYQTSFY